MGPIAMVCARPCSDGVTALAAAMPAMDLRMVRRWMGEERCGRVVVVHEWVIPSLGREFSGWDGGCQLG